MLNTATTGRRARTRRYLARAAVLAVVPAAVAMSGAAHAAPPLVETTTPEPYDIELRDADSPCEFPIHFTGAGTVRITSFKDKDGATVRTTIHGALIHTVYSEKGSVTLTSSGPAHVSIDPATGQQVITGMQYAFILPGHGPVMMTAGRLVLPTDGTPPSLTGLDGVDAQALCAALSAA